MKFLKIILLVTLSLTMALLCASTMHYLVTPTQNNKSQEFEYSTIGFGNSYILEKERSIETSPIIIVDEIIPYLGEAMCLCCGIDFFDELRETKRAKKIALELIENETLKISRKDII